MIDKVKRQKRDCGKILEIPLITKLLKYTIKRPEVVYAPDITKP